MRAIPREVIRFGLLFFVLAIGRFLGAPVHPFAQHAVLTSATRLGGDVTLHSPLGVLPAVTGTPSVRVTFADGLHASWSDTTRVRFRRPPPAPPRF